MVDRGGGGGGGSWYPCSRFNDEAFFFINVHLASFTFLEICSAHNYYFLTTPFRKNVKLL